MGRLAIVDDRVEQMNVRLAAGWELASSLVGLDRASAEDLVVQHGYRPQLIPPTADAISASLDANRIRLFLDERDVVIRATAG